MTRRNLFLTLCTLLPIGAVATTVNDTIAHVRQADKVLILENKKENGSEIYVGIHGCDTDSTYALHYNFATTKNTSSDLRLQGKRWDFSILLSGNEKKNGTRQYINAGGLGIGFANAVGAPDDMEIDMGSSYEIFCNLLTWNSQSASRRHTYSFGIGLNWINYRMTGKKRFVKEGTDINIVDYPEGASIDFSRIKVFSLPLTLKYTHHPNKHFEMYAAANLHLNTYASIKTRYTLDDRKHKDISKNIHQRNATVSFMVGATYRGIGFYAKYSPCEVLSSDYAPKFQSFSAGLTFCY